MSKAILASRNFADKPKIANYMLLAIQEYKHFSSNTKVVGRSLDR
jgi:hypothetical protein